ncbi:MAG TPA: glycosyltransferase family 39 protein [Pseudolabrys sp.]|nr:glycosyltransferase family 39 protein [Pseudolabrys sp.]
MLDFVRGTAAGAVAVPAGGSPNSLQSRFLARLLTGQGVFVFWLVFGIVHAVYRFSYSGTLALDDSRASELVQSFAWGYQARQPPIYEWMLWCLQQVLGTGILSFLVLRFSLFAALGCAIYMATTHAVRDRRFAALASLSICANYQIGWSFLESGTQSIVLSLTCFCTFDAIMRFASQRSLRHAAWLGFAVGAGFLSKHSYALTLLGMTLAALTLPKLRDRLYSRRLLLSAPIAFLIVSPYVIWLAQAHGDVVASSEDTLITMHAPHLVRSMHGFGKLMVSLVTFSTPWIIVMAVFAPAAFRRAPAAPPPTTAERLAGRTIGICVTLAAMGILAIGATNIGERYMYPLLIMGPLYMLARIERCAGSETLIERLGTFLVCSAAIVFVVRVFSVIDIRVMQPDPYHTLVAYDRLAEELKVRGLVEGSAFVPDVRIAGNLRAVLPGLRVITADSFRLQCPPARPADSRVGFALWDSSDDDPRVTALVPLSGQSRERISIEGRHSILGGRRVQTWTLVRLDANALACARCAPQPNEKICVSRKK